VCTAPRAGQRGKVTSAAAAASTQALRLNEWMDE
jgi:hypothetical protein